MGGYLSKMVCFVDKNASAYMYVSVLKIEMV